jgi:hypothetical protein
MALSRAKNLGNLASFWKSRLTFNDPGIRWNPFCPGFRDRIRRIPACM